jgi:hypothetical protein
MKKPEHSIDFQHHGISLTAFFIPHEYSAGEYDIELTAIYTAGDPNADILPIVSSLTEDYAAELALEHMRS